ncbi:Probable Co/Zn/Cd efflux system membrane fusion protein [hydrothermal vent metagenome]|uniref:Probable Co/Zn/Cd efflux system membrane fusion protein n=1 Tax=hydrothermal vent metagenome TaxID=652676 RepID=A0A3B0T091_9ZZZZ
MSFLKQIGLLILLIAIGGGGYTAYERFSESAGETQEAGPRRGGFGPAPVETEAARLGRIEDRIEAVGTTLARRAIEIMPMAAGRVVEILFVPGQKVSADQVLARLDDDIERADLAEAEARFDEAVLALKRADILAKSNTVSRASIEQLTTALSIAKAQTDRARRRFADRKVKAPFAGIVGLTQVEAGMRIDERTMITTLDDLAEVEIEFALPETVYGKIRLGLPVKASAAAFPGRAFDGAITTIDSRIDMLSRSFKVRALVPNADLTLPAGMFMHLAVILDTRRGLMVAEEAITAKGKSSTVFIVDDGKAVLRTVTLGAREFGQVEITNGLAPGDLVVVRGIQRLRDGAVVRPAGKGAPPKKGKTPGGAGKKPDSSS